MAYIRYQPKNGSYTPYNQKSRIHWQILQCSLSVVNLFLTKSLFTGYCVSCHKDNIIPTFTTAGDKAAYRMEVRRQAPGTVHSAILSEEAEEVWYLAYDPQQLFQLCGWEHVDQLHNSVVWQHLCYGLQKVLKTAVKIIRTPLPSLLSVYHHRIHRIATSLLKDPISL